MGKVKKGREGSCLDRLDCPVSCPLKVVTPRSFLLCAASSFPLLGPSPGFLQCNQKDSERSVEWDERVHLHFIDQDSKADA